MNEHKIHCIMPPAPELEKKIVRSKKRFFAGEALPKAIEADVLDLRTLSLITTRPNKTRAHTLVSPTKMFAPVLGTRKTLVLLVDFSDKAAAQTQSHYNDMLFSTGTYTNGSMRDFYREASYNKLDVTGSVSGTGSPTAGWYRVPNKKSYYTDGNYGFNSYPKNAQKLVEDVIDLANPYVNFADYDNDGDGVVDALVIIAAGSGGEATGNTGDFWSHKWSISPKSVDGVTVQTYFMAPEDGRVGVMSHELGHLLLGWPDLYDTDYSSAGTGGWDLMAGGSWNNGGHTPAHPTCWCKLKVGWINPVTIFNAEQSVTIKPYSTNPQAYKLPIGNTNSKEYFLITNRQKTGFDTHLPGEGMIIEHVDDNQSNNTDESHYLVDIEQCDGKSDLNKNANRGDATDPFPCGTNSKFTVSTTPNSKAYDGSDSKVRVTNIQRTGDNITAVVNAGEAVVKKWYYNMTVLLTYSSHHSQNAWANVTGLGWRKVQVGSADGVTNMFISLCEAHANNKKVHLYMDSSAIYRIQLV